MFASTFGKLAVLGLLATSAAAGSNGRRQMGSSEVSMPMNSTVMMMNSTITMSNGMPALELCNTTLTPDASGTGMTQISECNIIPIESNGNGGFTTGQVASTTSFSTDLPAATEFMASSSSAPLPTGTWSSSSSAVPTPSTTAGSPVRRQNAAGSSPSPSATGGILGAPADPPFTTQLPGRAILVEPIGLIIYCAVTGIMLIIIAAVTLERIKYRRQFRRQQQMYQNSAVRPGQAFADNRV